MTLNTPISRNEITMGHTPKAKTACGNLYTTINYDDNYNLIECFVRASKTGGCAANLEGLGRMISLAMRYKIPIKETLKQLHGIRCPACTAIRAKEQERERSKNKGELPKDFQYSVSFSCPDSVAKAIAKTYNSLKKERENNGKSIQKKV